MRLLKAREERRSGTPSENLAVNDFDHTPKFIIDTGNRSPYDSTCGKQGPIKKNRPELKASFL